MRPRRPSGIGQRRDDGVRRIRSNGAVRYPSVELPEESRPRGSYAAADQGYDDGRRLSPALDTGLEIQTRVSRQQESAARRQRTTIIAWVAGIALVITAAIGWRYISDRMAAATPMTAETAAAGAAGGGKASKALNSHGSLGGSVNAAATPVFASYGKLKLHLPIAMSDLTEIGFHQASYAYALRMNTPMKDANLADAQKNKSTGRDRSKQPTGDANMTGYVIRMWRNRPGRPDTAADVGALAGTTVLAPVNGTIVKIKSYLLYGRYPDFEVHIHPDGTSGLDLVMIHLTNLTCSVGDHVDAGLTPLAKVRKLSDKFHDQLAEYTRGGGDHVHIQINNANFKGYKGLYGAISVPRSGSGTVSGGAPTAGGSDAEGTDDSSSGD